LKNSLSEAIEDLYQTYKTYKVEDPKKVGCFDMGPTQDEVEGLSNELRNIPDRTLANMEFYGSGWKSWGSKSDVGYFLPRLMQYIANDVSRLEIRGVFSLFPFKLEGFFSDSNKEWNLNEKASLRNFMAVLFKERFAVDVDVGFLIEWALILHLENNLIISSWNSIEKFNKEQVVSLLVHFDCYKYGEADLGGSCYYDSKRIQAFIDSLFTKLTEVEIGEIFRIIETRYIID